MEIEKFLEDIAEINGDLLNRQFMLARGSVCVYMIAE